MAVVFKAQDGLAHLSEIVNYSILAEAMPIDATDSSGSTGSMDVTFITADTTIDKDGNRVARPGYMRSSALLGREVSLIDYAPYYTESKFDYQKSDQGRGSFFGVVSSMNSSAGGTTNFSVDSLLFKFNCEKTAEPHFGATATQKTAFIYYCSLADVTVLPSEVSDDFDVPVIYAAWKGNVWEHIKMFCVANKADILVTYDGKISLRKIRQNTISVIENSNASTSVNLLGSSRAIEMYHYDNSWEQDFVIYSSETSFQLNKGEQVTELVDVDFSTTTDKIIQPVCVERISPNPFVGGVGQSVYVVIDHLNYPVKPEWWNNNGGKVYVGVSKENPLQLEIKIQAPNQENSAYVEPFKLAQAYDDVVKGSLYICGEGVKINKKLRKIATGADETFISRDSKATVDNPFVTDISYHLLQSSAYATGPAVSVSLTIGKSNLPYEINEIAGSRFMHNNGFYRVINANVSDSGIGLTGKADTTFDDLTNVFAETFGEFNTNANFTPNTFYAFNNQVQLPTLGSNLISNDSFETNITGWDTYLASSLSRSTTVSYAGLASLKHTSTSGAYVCSTLNNLPVIAGKAYSMSAYARTEVVNTTMTIGINWWNAGGYIISQPASNPISVNPSSWTRVSFSATAPANAVYGQVVFITQAAGSGSESIFYDSVSLVESTFLKFNEGYPAKTFDEVGESYTELTFSDMAFMPLGDKLNLYGY
jgi:hypothetical protein